MFDRMICFATTAVPETPAPSRRRAWGAFTAAALLIAFGLGYRALASWLSAETSVAIRLPRPLGSLDLRFGAWQGTESPLSEGVLRIAGNDDYVSRDYHNVATGEVVYLYVAYTGRPRTMLRHRPTVCYPNAGWLHASTEDLVLTSDAGFSAPALLHTFVRTGGSREQRIKVLNYYVLNGQATTDENRFWGLQWRTPNLSRDASRYVAQVQIAAVVRSTEQAAEDAVQTFARVSLPVLRELLPETGRAAPAATP